MVRQVQRTLEKRPPTGPYRLLFSAHGLPKRVVASDPHQWQVELTVAADHGVLGERARDHVICYQSRVGPPGMDRPATEAELGRAARDKVAAVVVPIAFVSEHLETLVELDIEYRKKARELGVPGYLRVPTVATDEAFIDGLAALVEDGAGAAGGRLAANRRAPLPGFVCRLPPPVAWQTRVRSSGSPSPWTNALGVDRRQIER